MEQTRNPRTENEQRIAEEYLSSLADLNCNSKPLINMLTMLAEENIDYAAIIVKVVEQHIAQVPPDFKLPILYLIDSIVKNVKGTYVQLFSQCIVNLFCGVFEMVHEKIRERMYALRQTWNDVFSPQKLYALDVKVKRLDGNWPITAKQPAKPAIHVNPNFLKNVGGATAALPSEMEEILQVKTRELLELKKRKLELELEQTKKHLEEQEHQLIQTTNAVATNVPVPPGVMPPVLGSVGAPSAVPFAPGMNTRMAAPNLVPQQQPIAVFNQNFQRNVRPPHLPPVQQQQQQNMGIISNMSGQGFPQGNNHHASNKPKVHPVNSALLNSVRQRDPRLSRQQQQLQQQQQNQLPPPSARIVVDARSGGDSNKASSASHRHGSSNNSSKSNRSRSKSPNRHTSSSSSRSSGNSGRSLNKISSSSNSNSSSRRSHNDKDRKRSESKSSTASSSSSSSNFDRRKATSSSAAAWSEHNKPGILDSGAPLKHDYNSFANNETVSSGKRKSNSPPSSPLKSKRSSKSSSSTSSSSTRRKATHSRSRSPNDYKDVDMRISHNNLMPEKRLTKMDIDSKSSPASSAASTISPIAVTAAAAAAAAATSSVNTTMSTSANFDLEKPIFNILEPCAPPSVTITSSSLDIDLRLLAPPPPSIRNSGAINNVKATKLNAVDEASSPSVSSSSSSTKTTNNVVADTNFKTLPLSSSSSSSLDVAASSSSLLQTQLDKNTSSSSSKNFNTTTISTTTTTTTTTSIKTTLPSKVSFKIQKPFNKLEKSTANSSSFTTTTSTSSAPVTAATGSGNVSDVNKNSINKLVNNTPQAKKEQQQQNTMMLVSGEKRTSGAALNSIEQSDEEPLQKKSKSTKIDMLFGSEDVDLRKEISAAHTTPPFMVINAAKEDLSKLQAAQDSWESEKKKNTMSFDEIRAKLLKTSKGGGSKFNKSEKFSKDPAQRFKLAELNMNDDSQEANDNKIRTILSQAQEMLESNAMNQEQYKDLVQKIMAFNEASKLKEAKKREALSNSQSNEPDLIILDSPEDCERNAARDAVLRKRIPKLVKGSSNDSPRSDGNNSPIYDDVVPHIVDDNANTTRVTAAGTTTSGKSSLHSKSGKEKRRKPSKWGEQVDQNTAQRVAWIAATANKRGNSFRATHNALQHPQLHNVAMRLNAPTPWQHNTVVGGGGVGAAVIPPQFVGMSIPIGTRSNIPPPPQPPNMCAMPPVPPNIPKPCNSIDNPQAEIMRSITIDGTSKDIRIYNQVAIVFMQSDVPHEIGFQPGQRSLIIDNMEPFTLQFNDSYKTITIDGILHHIRFGFPSRELYIDDHWYEIYFGGPPVSIPIRNKLHILKAEGPPPQVNIGAVRRDLVVGKINMIVDAHTIVPLFLDAKVQTFQLADQQHTIQFVDGFLNVLFDGDLHQVEYGGLPKSIDLNGRKYFIRFGTLPHGVMPGKVQIQDMVYIKTEAPLSLPLQSDPAIVGIPVASNDLLMKVDMKPEQQLINEKSESTVAATAVPTLPAALDKVNIDELFQKLVSSGIIGGATAALPIAAPSADSATSNANKAITPLVTANPTITTNSDETNANATTQQPQATAAALSPAIPTEPITPINLEKTDTIKTRQPGIIALIFSGMQCSSCGLRFPPEQTIRYSQHLDWHFRKNRRERDSSRKALSRKWFYKLNEWVQYEEIEDLEEREKIFMEATQNGPDANDDASNQRSLDGEPSTSCAAGSDDVDRACDMCHEKFEQFYNEELEEWHLRSAIRVEDKIYHPLCYEDYKASLNPPVMPTKTNKSDSEAELNTTDDNAVDTVINIKSVDKDEEKDLNETTAATDIDDDDDVILLPNEEPSVMEIIDDDIDDGEYVPTNVSSEEASAGGGSSTTHKEADESQEKEKPNALVAETPESDVEIQEPHIPFTDLDNYVEKELPEDDEATQAALLNVKIKEEPKDDDFDEDDGFEDVGTVLLVPGEEISIHSSEDTQTHTIASSASPVTERPSSVTSLSQSDALELELEPSVSEQSIIDLNASMDGNLETQETHNLSATGPAPALPMASLVNKIKINITKNTGSSSSSNSGNNTNNNNNNNNSTSNVTVTTTSAAATTSSLLSSSVLVSETNASQISVIGGGHHTTNIDKKISSSNNSSNSLGEVNSIQTISTIPVLCGGNTIVPKITTSGSTSINSSNSTNNNNSNISGTGSAPSNISSISVIGSSYGNNSSNMSRFTMMSKPSPITTSTTATPTTTNIIKPDGATQSTSAAATTSAKVPVAAATPTVTARQSTPPPAAEPEPEPLVLKPALRNIKLKKSQKVVNGIETSGLCSIM